MRTFERTEAERVCVSEVHNGASAIRRDLMVQYLVKAIVCLAIAAVTAPWAMRFLLQYIDFLERTQI